MVVRMIYCKYCKRKIDKGNHCLGGHKFHLEIKSAKIDETFFKLLKETIFIKYFDLYLKISSKKQEEINLDEFKCPKCQGIRALNIFTGIWECMALICDDTITNEETIITNQVIEIISEIKNESSQFSYWTPYGLYSAIDEHYLPLPRNEWFHIGLNYEDSVVDLSESTFVVKLSQKFKEAWENAEIDKTEIIYDVANFNASTPISLRNQKSKK